MKESNAMSRYSKSMSDTMAEVRANEEKLLEVSPPGFKGTVKAMKKHDEIDNPYALAWHMKNKGDEARYKNKDGRPEKKEKYKEDVDEANLPPHLAKFFDKKGNPKAEVAKRMAAGQKKRAVAYKSKDVTPKGYGPNEEVEVEEAREKLGRQLIDPKKEVMVVRKNKVVVISKKDQDKYLKMGWKLAESVEVYDVDALHAEALQENELLNEVEWKVQLKGLPVFYVPAKSAGEVRAMLKKQIKKPDDIISVERVSKAEKKKDFRGRVQEK
jgi:hypothetical protein